MTSDVGQAGLIVLMQQALREPIGLGLRSDQPERLRQLLYQARAKAGDPGFAQLQFRLAPAGADFDLAVLKAPLPRRPQGKVLELEEMLDEIG